MTTPAGFAGKMRALSVAIPAVMPEALYAAGRFVEANIEADAPERLRNVGKSGGRIGARTIPSRMTGVTSEVEVKATGAFQLIERPIARHTIEPRGDGAAVGHPLVIPGSESGFAMSAEHPGVQRSEGPFARGVRRSAPFVVQIVDRSVGATLRAII